jgi:RNA polymerase sigma-70 factor, ECF subfamily
MSAVSAGMASGPGSGEELIGRRPPNEATDDPAELMRRVALADEAAFEAIYDRFAAHVYGVSLKVLHDQAQAQEVTQEVFLELWRQAPRFDPSRASVKTWLAVLAHRRAVDRVRSEQSRSDREERQVRATPSVPADDDPVATTVDRRLDRDRVRQALWQLSDVQRQAVELAYFQGYTYRQVAVALGIPEGTIKTRIRDGMVRLRSALEVTW